MVLCDTDVMIEFLKGNAATKNLLENNIRPENIALSSPSILWNFILALKTKENLSL
ncbi:MAG: hypothetical protein ACYCSW_02595 [bacterium]|jgi:predicted nucleic acid-binding protein